MSDADETWWDVDPLTLPPLPEWAYEPRPPADMTHAHPGWVYLIEREKAQHDWTAWLAAPSRGSELYHSGVLDGLRLGLELARLSPLPDWISSDDGVPLPDDGVPLPRPPALPQRPPQIPGIKQR